MQTCLQTYVSLYSSTEKWYIQVKKKVYTFSVTGDMYRTRKIYNLSNWNLATIFPKNICAMGRGGHTTFTSGQF